MKSPVIISLQTAFIATTACIITGILVARLILNHKKVQPICDIIATLSMVFPPTVTGFILLRIFGKSSFIGQLLDRIGWSVVFSFSGAVIASIVVSFPLMYRTALGAFQQIDEEIIYAARTLGLSETKIFFRVLLPNAWQGLFSGAVLTFARALGEFGATIMLAGNIPGKTQTVAIAIYQAVLHGDEALAYRYVCIMALLSLLCLSAMNVVIKGKRP